MTPEREKMIRDLWARYERDGIKMLETKGFFHALPPMKAHASTWDNAPLTEKTDFMEYRIEQGMIDHKPMSRVICEDIEVAVFPRAAAAV